MNLQSINASASPEVGMNENFETLDHQSVYGKRHPATTGLTWGYCGGRWGGIAITAGTLTLTDDDDNYIVVAIATGAISVSTATTNWADDANYTRVYKITTADGAVTTVEDHRAGPLGVHGGGGGGGGGSYDLAADIHGASGKTTPVDADELALVDSADSNALKKLTVDNLKAALQTAIPICLAIACSDESTALTTGTAKAKFINPYSSAFNVTAVVASLSTAQASGSTFTVDINEAGTTILSTKLTIDNTETNSSTAATPAVISDASIAAYAEISVDIDQVGDGTAKGLKVYLLGHL